MILIRRDGHETEASRRHLCVTKYVSVECDARSDLNGGGDVALQPNVNFEAHAVRPLPPPHAIRMRSGFSSSFAVFG